MTEKNMLSAWYFLESINPGELKKNAFIEGYNFSDGTRRANMNALNADERPWETIHLAKNSKKQLQFQYFIDCYPQYQLIKELRTLFESEEPLINLQYNNYFGFTFTVNQDGKYVDDSLFIPFIYFVLHKLQENRKLTYDGLHHTYKEHIHDMEERAKSCFADGVYDETIQAFQKDVHKHFYFPKSTGNTTNKYEIKVLSPTNQNQDAHLNSFFLEDLENIMKASPNATLKHFLNGQDLAINVNENRETIEGILQPKDLPMGRWPSPVEHRLTLMQQVAVNTSLNTPENVISVNGPPGTGKTTLLQDIFANLVVKRAKVMTAYKEPSDAFTKIGKVQIAGTPYQYNVHELDQALTEYSMVVASSNNGAVENISKDLPQRSEIIREPDEKAAKNHHTEYEERYAEAAKEVDYFPQLSANLIGDNDTWGVFSAALGNSKNIKDVGQAFNRIEIQVEDDKGAYKKKTISFANLLKHENQQLDKNAWKDAVKDFLVLYDSVQQKKDSLQSFIQASKRNEKLSKEEKKLQQKLDEARTHMESHVNQTISLEKQKQLIQEQIANLPEPSFFKKLISKTNPEEEPLRKDLYEVNNQLLEIERKTVPLNNSIDSLSKKTDEINNKLNRFNKERAYYDEQNLVSSTDAYWEEDRYDERQQQVLWQTDELNFERGLLFIKAMQIHKLFLIKSHQENKFALALLSNRNSLHLNEEKHLQYARSMWNVLHLITPVISTTFASFTSMYRGIDADFISYLFIDEAGQASPQQAAGALWRSKKAIVVGDPIQIEPVVTLDQTILHDIREKFGVNEKYIGLSASVQSMADHANPFGMYKGKGDEKHRIGIPLWVHRRCKNPMFSIANAIAYDNKMVLADNKKNAPGEGKWYHFTGKAAPAQYVKEQGKFVIEKIKERISEENGLPNVYVISPFTMVASEIKKELRKELKTVLGESIPSKDLNKWINQSVGTVHTFQGKEAKTVFFVTGTDQNTDGAANWSCSKPNLLNVAVTRAKDEFYIVGDYERFKNKEYYAEIVENVGKE